MASQWQYIPDTVIDDVDRRKKADEWAASERQRLADEWAAQQQTMLSKSTPTLEQYNAGRGFVPGASDIQGPGDAGIYPPMKEMLRRGVEDQQGALPRVMNRISSLAEPAAEFIARGGERLGAAVRGEDWQSMPSGYDANESLEQNIVDLRAGYKQRPEHFPGEKFITQIAADPTNVVPSGLLGKAGMTVVREGRPIAEAAGALSKYVPGMTAESVGKLPKMADNYRKPLSDYANTLYHETSLQEAETLMPHGNILGNSAVPQKYMSNTPDLALGQGANKGVLLEFDAAPLHGQVNTSKPTWQTAYDQGQAEFIATHNDEDIYRQALRSITIKPDSGKHATRGQQVRIQRLLDGPQYRDWTKTKNPDGSITYTKSDMMDAAKNVSQTSETVAKGLKLSNTNLEPSNIEQVTGEVIPPGTRPPSGGDLPPGGGDDIPLLTGPEKAFEPPAKKKALGWDIAWDRIRNVAARQGPAGKQLAENLHGWREQYQTQTGDWTTRMPNVKALNDSEYKNFVDSVEGYAKPANDKVFRAVVDWARVDTEVEDKAIAAGIKMGHLPGHFPHMYESKVIEKHFAEMDTTKWNRILDRMVQTKQADSREEANRILRMIADDVHTRKANNLEMSRVADFPDYRRDKAVLGEYLADAAKRIAFAEKFGVNGEKADDLLQQIAAQGYDKHGELNKLFGIATGGVQYGFREQKVSNFIRAANVLTKMNLGAISNATQPVNTTVVGGLKTLKLLPEAATSKQAHDFAIRIGVITDDALNDVNRGTGFGGKTMKYGAPGHNNVERFNRTFSALAGRDMVENFAEKVVKAAGKGKQDRWAEKGLQSLGLDPAEIISRAAQSKGSKALTPLSTTSKELSSTMLSAPKKLTMPTEQVGLMPSRSGLLTQQEIDKAARNIVERTQFLVDPQDLPAWTSSPWGRVIMQFRTYGYNQTAFMWREVIQKALPERLGGNRDVGPLIRFLIFGTTVGMGTVAVKDMVRGTDSTDRTPQDWVFRGIQQIGGLATVGEILTGLKPSDDDDDNYRSGERYAIQTMGLLGGPSASTFMEGAATVPSALDDDPERLERFLLKQTPYVGPLAANRLMPYGPKKSKAPNRYPGRYTPPKSNTQKAPVYPGRR